MNPTIEEILQAWLAGKTVIEYMYNSQRNEYVFSRYCTPGTDVHPEDTRWYEYEISDDEPEKYVCEATFVVDGHFVYLTDDGKLTHDSVDAKAFKTKEEAKDFINDHLPPNLADAFKVSNR